MQARAATQEGVCIVRGSCRFVVTAVSRQVFAIGDCVPVITTTAAATGGFVSESVSYLDVGLKLEVEPVIYLEDEVGMRVGLEVSNIVKEVKGTNNNTLTYQIGTRNASTSLRLRDGETEVLAGLISDLRTMEFPAGTDLSAGGGGGATPAPAAGLPPAPAATPALPAPQPAAARSAAGETRRDQAFGADDAAVRRRATGETAAIDQALALRTTLTERISQIGSVAISRSFS
jgi:hypothetical protein